MAHSVVVIGLCVFNSARSNLALRSGSDVEEENISHLTLANCARSTAAVPAIQSGKDEIHMRHYSIQSSTEEYSCRDVAIMLVSMV